MLVVRAARIPTLIERTIEFAGVGTAYGLPLTHPLVQAEIIQLSVRATQVVPIFFMTRSLALLSKMLRGPWGNATSQ